MRGVELQTARGQHARQLDRQRRAASVVVGAGSIDVVVLIRAKLRVGGRLAARSRVGADLPGAADVDRVVVCGQVDSSRASSRAAPPGRSAARRRA